MLRVETISHLCYAFFISYDFGITAWNVLSIKAKGFQKVTPVYEYLADHPEMLGLLVACVPIGGAIGGVLGGLVRWLP